MLEEKEGLCAGAPYVETLYLFEGVTGTDKLPETLRKDGFRSLFVAQSEAWEVFFFFFLRIDTSLLSAACWAMASGMKLASHVKAQCGETRQFDCCCEILSEAEMSWTPDVSSSDITNHCPWDRSTFSSTLIARKHAAASTLSGHCRADAGALLWPITPPKSLQCSLCDDDDTAHTSIDGLFDHSVAVHLPLPCPVSLPIATAFHDASGAQGNRQLWRMPPWEKFRRNAG